MSWLKRLGRKILGGGKSALRKILNVGQGARKLIGGAYSKIKSVPILGDIVDKALDTKVVGGRLSIKDVLNNAGQAIEAGDKAYSGDFKGAYDEAKQMKFKKGGMVGGRTLRMPQMQQNIQDTMRGMTTGMTTGQRVPKFRVPKPWMNYA